MDQNRTAFMPLLSEVAYKLLSRVQSHTQSKSGRYTGITGAGREMVHVPFCLGAIGVFHSVPAGEALEMQTLL